MSLIDIYILFYNCTVPSPGVDQSQNQSQRSTYGGPPRGTQGRKSTNRLLEASPGWGIAKVRRCEDDASPSVGVALVRRRQDEASPGAGVAKVKASTVPPPDAHR